MACCVPFHSKKSVVEKDVKLRVTRFWLELANQWLEATQQFFWLDSDSKKFWMTLTRQKWLGHITAGQQVNLATITKMIHKSKGSVVLIGNPLIFDWRPHTFCWIKRIGAPYHDQRKALLILWLGAFDILVAGLLLSDRTPCLLINYSIVHLCYIIWVWLLIFRFKTQMCQTY